MKKRHHLIPGQQPRSQLSQVRSSNPAGADPAHPRWTQRQQRWQVGFDWNYDLEENSSNWLLQLQWHGGEGRGLRDFRPGEIDFDTIRKYRARQADNNRISPVFDEAPVENR